MARILVVEDEPSIQELISVTLTRTGHDPLRAPDAETALRLLQAELPLVENRALPGYLRFYVKDPAGNQLEFLEPDNDPQEISP